MIQIPGLKQQEKKTLTLLFFCYILLVAAGSYFQYTRNYKASRSEIDGILVTAANCLEDILGKDFHNRYTIDSPMNKEKYRVWVRRLNDLVDRLGIEFLYSMAKVDGKVYFVVSNETKEDIERKTFSVFYNPYPDPPEDLMEAFRMMESRFSSYTNKWGSFRSFFLPRQTDEGLRYVLAADIKAHEMEGLIKESVASCLLFAFLFLLPVIPVFLIYRSMMLRRRADLERQLYYDRLTGLPNRNRLIEDLKSLPVGDISAVLLNIDSFKEINTLFGSNTGDDLLIETASLLAREKSASARLYRMPSDEFMLITDQKDSLDAEQLTRYLLSCFSSSVFRKNGHEISITVSAGIAKSAKNADHLLSSVNIAKTIARKHQYGYFVYTETLNQEIAYQENLFWLKALKNALKNDRIVPFFQPIMNNRTGRVEKYEALVRMIDEEGNTVPPSKFLTISKKSKLYSDVTKQVIEKTFVAFAQREYSVSLNFTTRDLLEDGTVAFLKEKMYEYKMEGRVILELVESEHLSKNETVVQRISDLKKDGVRIAIDDFGSGYSNFEYFLRLQADFIKIDGTLIRNIRDNADSAIIVRAIRSFAKKLNMRIIAEFVSSAEIQEEILSMDIEYSQGFHIGHPAPVRRLTGMKIN